jgi:sulfite exporter TauE/SafE/copper chaperone CopZ
MVKKTYIVNGMHCSACEINVERAVKKIKGIKSAKATLVDSKLTITAQSEKNLPTVHQINSTIKKYGYEIVPHGVNTKTKQKTFSDYFWVGIGITVFITIFLLAGDSAFISGVYVTPESNAVSFFLFGLAAGISSCAALVGGMILSVQNSWLSNKDGKPGNKYLPFIMFNGSRLVTYAVLGGLLGLLGRALKISIFGSAILTIVISVFMFVVGMQMVGFKWLKGIAFNPFRRMFNHGLDESDKTSNIYPIAMGALTFFVPCGFTIIAQTQAIGSGSFWMGFVSLSAFAFGTLPVLALISFSSIKLHSNPRFSSAFQLFSGILVIFFALFSINGQIGILGLPQLSSVFMRGGGSQSDTVVEAAPEITEMPSTIASPQNFQIMMMEARGFEYFPKVITIKANMPTRFEITDSGSIGCARAVYPPGLYDQIILLQPGLNTVEFTSPEPGRYQISCSMWMVDPITVIVE